MLRLFALAVLSITLGVAAPARAQYPAPEFPEPIECVTPPDDPSLGEVEKAAWSACEKWVWSCIRDGKEANLFAKICIKPRTSEFAVVRRNSRLAAFRDPSKFASSNGISGTFLLRILTDPDYLRKIPNTGVRIFGAYFESPVNLENVTTTVNLILDGSIARSGFRLTNFRSDKNLSLDSSNIRGSIFLMRAQIDGAIFMEQSVFDAVEMTGIRLGSSLEATGSVFNGFLGLRGAKIEGTVVLTKARLTTLDGTSAAFGGSLYLRGADIRLGIDLTGSTVDGNLELPDVTFGRQTGTPARCDWDPSVSSGHILSELNDVLTAAEFDGVRQDLVDERRPQRLVSGIDACKNARAQGKLTYAKYSSALLRDMKINGTLCIVDVSGEISGDGVASNHLETITLDGTEAKSTILSWKRSPSKSLWHIFNFKTNYLLVNLDAHPYSYYVDSIDVGSVSFLRNNTTETDDALGQEKESVGYIPTKCEIPVGIENTETAGDRSTQDRLIGFFRNNRSGNSQPFTAIVDRIEASGVESSYLREALTDYKIRNVCSRTPFFQAWDAKQRQAPLEPSWRSAQMAWIETANLGAPLTIVLDSLCTLGKGGYKYVSWFKGEPRTAIFVYDLICLVLLMIAIFAILLRFDNRPPEHNAEAAPPRLGLMYAIDTFHPFGQMRLAKAHDNAVPGSPRLRRYLKFHRFIGTVLSIALAVLVYFATK